MIRKAVRATCVVLCALVFSSCGGGGGGSSPTPTPATYSIRANVSGLFGAGLELSLNSGQSIGVSGNGATTLASAVQNGQNYSVAVVTQPTNPAQQCTLANPSTTVNGSNVEVAVACSVVSATAMLTSVTIDTAEPAWARDRIVSIVSAEGETNVGGQVAIPWGPGDSIGPVMALDGDGQIVFAAMGGTRSLVLSSNSTAIFLTRTMMGSAADGQPSPAVDTAIRATAGMANLEAKVRAAYVQEILPLASRDVVTAINAVIADLPATIRDPRSRKGSRLSAQAISESRINHPLPAAVVSAGYPSWMAVKVTGASANGGLNLANGMPIAWKASTAGPDGEPLCGPADPGCGMLDRSSLIGAGLRSEFGIENWFADEVTGNGTAVDLTLLQTAATRNANIYYITSELLGVLFDGLLPGATCKQSIISGFLSTEEIIDAFNEPTPKPVLESLANIQIERLESLIGTYATECAWKDPAAFSKAARGFIKKALLIYQALDAVYTAVDIAYVMDLTAEFWNTAPITFGVCMAPGQLFGFNISNCVDSYTFDPPDVYIGPGAVTRLPRLVAKDVGGVETFPGQAVYTPSSARPELFQFDPVDLTVTSLDPNALETFEVQVDDPATGATGTGRIHTVWPQIAPGYGNLAAGAELKFILTDDAGHPLKEVAQGVEWKIRQGDEISTALSATMSLDGVSATVRIPDPVPAGEFSLTAHCLECFGGLYATVPLHLGVPHVKLEFTTPPAWTGTPNYGLWASAWFAGAPGRCISFSGEYRRRMWNRLGELTRDDMVSGSGSACMQTGGLGDWILRSDGKYWGLMLSGGIGTGGRMQFDGVFFFDIPGTTNPFREQRFNCNVTESNWTCGPS